MNILVAPDSFKGSATAKEVGEAMNSGILNACSAARIEVLPMADGGEGTMINLVEALDGRIVEVQANDPLGRPSIGHYGIIDDNKIAIVELSSLSGLNKLQKEELNPFITSTFGTGQLILDALKKGIRQFIVCLGGSATNDGGVGILKALGYKFLDKYGEEIAEGGLALNNLYNINDSCVPSYVHESFFHIACDVQNPLIGSDGASSIFGPQKGASPEMAAKLDKALKNFNNYINIYKKININKIPGSGAAGGTAGGLLAFLNADLQSGIELVMEAVNFEEKIRKNNFDLLLTGEGKIDGQTAFGKLISGVLETANKFNLPTVAVAGSIEGSLNPLHKKGLISAFSITNGPMPLEETMENTTKLIEKQTEQIFRLYIKSNINYRLIE